MRKHRFPATLPKARYVLWLVYNRGLTQTEAAILVELNVGTVCHIVHGRRFPHAHPLRFPGI